VFIGLLIGGSVSFLFSALAISVAAMLGIVYGIKKLAVEGVEAVPVAALVLGLVLGVVFVVRQRTAESPLLDTALFRMREFSGSIAVNLVANFCFIGITLFTNQYLQLVLGLSPFTAALWSLAVESCRRRRAWPRWWPVAWSCSRPASASSR
jgi:DHA2 family multidrug resistance protein-like MFS transporter